MTHMPDAFRAEAAAAIATMQDAAKHARAVHARAELIRHMVTTATKLRGRSRPEAVAGVVGEWMAAWSLDVAAWAEMEAALKRFTVAACDYVDHPSETTDAAWRAATTGLEDGFKRQGTTLADQMAWRSECAHGWWAAVTPPPAQFAARPGVPSVNTDEPFWAAGCAPHCGNG